MIEIECFQGDTANWTFTLKRGDSIVDLANATAVLDVPFLGITSAPMIIDGITNTATYVPAIQDTLDKQCYRASASVTVTFVDGKVETFPFVLTVKPRGLWERVSPTTSTSSSTSSSTSTTTTL